MTLVRKLGPFGLMNWHGVVFETGATIEAVQRRAIRLYQENYFDLKKKKLRGKVPVPGMPKGLPLYIVRAKGEGMEMEWEFRVEDIMWVYRSVIE